MEPEFRELFQSIKKTLKKNTLASNADSGLLVALSAPRSAFPADFQLAGASKRPNGGHLEKSGKNAPPCTFQPMAYTACMGDYLVLVFWVEFLEKLVSKALFST